MCNAPTYVKQIEPYFKVLPSCYQMCQLHNIIYLIVSKCNLCVLILDLCSTKKGHLQAFYVLLHFFIGPPAWSTLQLQIYSFPSTVLLV